LVFENKVIAVQTHIRCNCEEKWQVHT
jgi:hypothetical protein